MESTVIVEYRPLLRTCQFFVKRSFDPVNTVITVTENNQVVFQSISGKLTIQLPESVALEPDVLSSGVSFLPDLVHFRVRARPPPGTGSFKAEVLLTGGDSNGNKSSISPYVPDVNLDCPVNLMCASCRKILANELVFSRILPLPNNEESDFFCHSHTESPMSIDPRSGDIFYGLYFFRLHSDTMESPEGVIECQQCRAWLGYKTRKYIQLFNSTVYFEGSESTDDCSIKDFLGIVELLSQENNWLMNKVILQCDVDNHSKKYLLLWIFDKDLSLFTVVREAPPRPDYLLMKEQKVAKVLYSYQLGATDLVRQWLQSGRASSVPLALPVLLRSFTYLEEMAQVIPQLFSRAYDMNMAYVVKTDK